MFKVLELNKDTKTIREMDKEYESQQEAMEDLRNRFGTYIQTNSLSENDDSIFILHVVKEV
jgi:hypothetical protein